MPYIYHDFVSPKTDSTDATLVRPSNWNARLKYSNTSASGPSGNDAIVREALTAARTYYVRTDGNDANTGLVNNAAGAFLTIQHAVDVVSASIDMNGNDVTIQVTGSPYNESITLKPYIGKTVSQFGPTIVGDIVTPSSVTVNGANSAFIATECGPWLVDGMKVTSNSAAYGSLHSASGASLFWGNIDFGSAAGFHVLAVAGGCIQPTKNYSISAGAQSHIIAFMGGNVRHTLVDYGAFTVTLTGTPNFSDAFAVSTEGGNLESYNATFVGLATGYKFRVTTNALIQTYLNNSDENYFPGDKAGILGSGGTYDEREADGLPGFSLVDFGAVGDGVTNCNTARDACVAACVAAGGGTIYVAKGDYLLTTGISFSVPIMWQGEAGARFICYPTVDNVDFFSQSGTGATVRSIDADSQMQGNYANNQVIACDNTVDFASNSYASLRFTNPNAPSFEVFCVWPVRKYTSSANQAATLVNKLSCTAGQPTINVNFTNHGRSVGDPLVINMTSQVALDNQFPSGYYEVTRIVDLDNFEVTREANFANTVNNAGGTVNVALYSLALAGPMPTQLLTTSAFKQIQPISPIIGGGFRDLDFISDGIHENIRGIYSTITANQTYENLKFRSFHGPTFHTAGSGCAMELYMGYSNHVYGITAEDCGSANINDVAFWWQTRLSGRDIRSSQAFDFGPGLYFSTFCYVTDVHADSAKARAMKFSNTHNSVINYVSANFCGFCGPDISGGSANNYIGVVQSFGCRDGNIATFNEGARDNMIGHVFTAGSYNFNDIQMFTNDINNTIDHVNSTKIANLSESRFVGTKTSYVPVATSSGGAITAYTINEAYFTHTSWNEVLCVVDITITTVGTATGQLILTIPSLITQIVNSGVVSGYDVTAPKNLSGQDSGNATQFFVLTYNGTSLFTEGDGVRAKISYRFIRDT